MGVSPRPEKVASPQHAKVDVHLPKILRMSSEELSSQGIYSSLKNFAAYDFAAQEKKLRSIIGLSIQRNDDESALKHYFKQEDDRKIDKYIKQ